MIEVAEETMRRKKLIEEARNAVIAAAMQVSMKYMWSGRDLEPLLKACGHLRCVEDQYTPESIADWAAERACNALLREV